MFGMTQNMYSMNSFKQREESLHSDHIDRDDGNLPLINTFTHLNLTKKNASNPLQKSITRRGTEIPSYKLDGAKLLMNRIQA